MLYVEGRPILRESFKIVPMCTMIVEARSLIISFRDHYTIQIKSHFDADFAKRAIDKSVCKLIPASGGFIK